MLLLRRQDVLEQKPTETMGHYAYTQRRSPGHPSEGVGNEKRIKK